jgi:hypothetical protein
MVDAESDLVSEWPDAPLTTIKAVEADVSDRLTISGVGYYHILTNKTI